MSLGAWPSHAQAAWPSRPIRFVVPFVPGGTSDIVARAASDGYTVILGHVGSMAVNPLIYPDSGFDVNRDFAPVTLLAGRVEAFSAGTPALLPHIRSGALRAIATGTPARAPALPEVPTVAEMGYKDFETVQWYGMLVPAQTPKDIVLRLQRDCLKALQSASIANRFASESAVIGGEPSEQFAAFIAREQRRWKDVVVRGNIKPG